ncbi:hypothetical protein C5137_29325 [Bacillus cereus]|nr:hypothetical protein [Bacillus cereus]
MNITQDSLRQLYTKEGLNTLINSYVAHIHEVYDNTKDQYMGKINQVKSFTFNPDDAENQLKDLKNRLASVTAKKNTRLNMYAQHVQLV